MQANKTRYYFTLLSIVLLYVSHTAPLYFVTFAMPTILRAENTSLVIIGLLGCLIIPWAFKFLWAPWLDRYYKISWGKRKSWIIPAQILSALLLSTLLFINPTQHPIPLFAILFLLSFLAATQDIASGAYIIEQLSNEQRPFGNYAQVIGTTLGSVCGGAAVLFCYGYFGWKTSVSCMLFLAVIFLLALFFTQENNGAAIIQRELPSLSNFWKRTNVRQLLYICLIYRGCEGLVMGMQQPFLVDIKIPVSTIGLVMGLGNLSIGLIGAGIVGLLFKPLGGWRLLIVLGGFRSLVYLGLFAIAFFHISNSHIIFSVVILNMALRLMEMVTLYTILMNECSSHQAATDFSILVCGELIIYMAGIALSGYLAEQLGYAGLFLFGSLFSIPSVIISAILLYKIHNKNDDQPKLIHNELAQNAL